MMMMMRRSSAVSLLLVLVLVSPSWIQDGVASRIVLPETPSPSPSSFVAESPNHHQPPSIISPISHQAPQMPPSISPCHAEASSPQMPELHHQIEPPSVSPSQAPKHQSPQMPPSISPSHAEAPSPQMPELHHHYEPPSVSPSQAPKMPPYHYDEPPSPSPSPSPSSPDHSFRPPSPSPISPPPHYHHHHHHHGPHYKPPRSSTLLQCWSHVMEVEDCSNEITMAFHGYSHNLKQSCCQAINRTSKDCLFDMLFSRTRDTFFIMWLREHCARAADA